MSAISPFFIHSGRIVTFVTKLYLTNIQSTYDPGVNVASWDSDLGHQKKLSVFPQGANLLTQSSENNAFITDYLHVRFVSGRLMEDVTISGTFNFCGGVKENVTQANCKFRVAMWVTQGDSSSNRGNLLGQSTLGSEWGHVSAAGQQVSSIALSSVAALNGDRIVIEYGVIYDQASDAETHAGDMYIGGTDATDLGSGDANVTTRPGWFEFSTPLPLEE